MRSRAVDVATGDDRMSDKSDSREMDEKEKKKLVHKDPLNNQPSYPHHVIPVGLCLPGCETISTTRETKVIY